MSAWLNKSDATITDYPVNGWIKANVGQYGFYVVNYPETNWNRLQAALVQNVDVRRLSIPTVLFYRFTCY